MKKVFGLMIGMMVLGTSAFAMDDSCAKFALEYAKKFKSEQDKLDREKKRRKAQFENQKYKDVRVRTQKK